MLYQDLREFPGALRDSGELVDIGRPIDLSDVDKTLTAFDATEETPFDKVVKGLNNPVDPIVVEGQAPCQEPTKRS
jgi:hypothetical protein